MFNRITMNFEAATLRYEMLEGQQHVVVPVVMLMEGVWCGSGGPLYYGPEQLGNRVSTWNHKPIVVYHPELEGEGISACDPVVMTKQKVGVILNTVYESDSTKLKAEAWLNVSRLGTVDPRIMAALLLNQKVEVSTGLFNKQELVAGVWQEKTYIGSATEFEPDHLAILPDKIGAMSVADGAGLLANSRTEKKEEPITLTINELSFDNIRSALRETLRAALTDPITKEINPYPYVMDVYPSFFIYELDGAGLWRLGYTIDANNVVTITGKPEQVIQVTEYRTITGTYVGNAAKNPKPIERGENVAKKDLVDKLISNAQTAWEEADRPTLMAMNEDHLGKMIPKEAAPVAPTPAPEPEKKKEEPVTTNKVQTEEEYIANAPGHLKESLSAGLAKHREERATLIKTITFNAKNKFTADQLNSKPHPELQMLADLAAPDEPAARYDGAGGYIPPLTTNTSADDVLVRPTMDFAPATK